MYSNIRILTFIDHYKPDITSPLYSPLLDEGGLRNLPPTYFQICGLDPLRDEGIIYKQELEKNGINVSCSHVTEVVVPKD